MMVPSVSPIPKSLKAHRAFGFGFFFLEVGISLAPRQAEKERRLWVPIRLLILFQGFPFSLNPPRDLWRGSAEGAAARPSGEYSHIVHAYIAYSATPPPDIIRSGRMHGTGDIFGSSC